MYLKLGKIDYGVNIQCTARDCQGKFFAPTVDGYLSWFVKFYDINAQLFCDLIQPYTSGHFCYGAKGGAISYDRRCSCFKDHFCYCLYNNGVRNYTFSRTAFL